MTYNNMTYNNITKWDIYYKKTLNNIRNSIKTRNTKKLNITKMDNSSVNRKFNGTMYFTK